MFVSSSTSLSGGTRQAMYLAGGLADRGHEVRFLVPEGAEIAELAPGLSWKTLPKSRFKWKKALDDAAPKDGMPCVVHAFHNKAVKAVAWWGLFRGGHPIAALGHRGVLYRPGNPLPYWSPGIDAFTANSWACAQVLRSIGVSKKRLFVVYNGLPEDRTRPAASKKAMRDLLDLPPGTPVVGTVAGDKPVKGVEHLIRAFARVDAEARLVLVGARRSRWARTLAGLGVSDRAVCTDRVENVADYLQIFDVFVLPSLSESMPNTLIEAIRMGLPVVASEVGGIPELVEENGILVPPGDEGALSAALIDILRHEKRRAAMAAMSRKVARRLSLEHKIDRSVRIYEEILERRGYSGGM